MVKIINRSGDEEKFDSKDIEKDLESAGLPERVAKEVAERVEDRVEDQWTSTKVNEQVDLELKRLEEDIQRAHNTYKDRAMGQEMRTEDRTRMPQYREPGQQTSTSGNRSETFIPETERERHQSRY